MRGEAEKQETKNIFSVAGQKLLKQLLGFLSQSLVSVWSIDLHTYIRKKIAVRIQKVSK